jgi:hypothetical protein
VVRVVSLASFDSYIEAGLDGIEVKHRDQTTRTATAILFDIAAKADLAMTGSSDYHGTGKMNELRRIYNRSRRVAKLRARASARRVVRA